MKSFDRFEKKGFRKERLQRFIYEVVSEMFAFSQVKDPVLAEAGITITRVACSDDLRYAKIYYSVLGIAAPDAAELKRLQAAFKRAGAYFYHAVSQELTLYKSPELTFVFDDQLHQTERVWRLIDQTSVSGSTLA